MKLYQKYVVHLPGEERTVEVARAEDAYLVRAARAPEKPSDPDAAGVADGAAAADVAAVADAAGVADAVVTFESLGTGRTLLRIDGRPVECRLTRTPDGLLRIEWRGRQVLARVADDFAERARRAAHQAGPVPLRSPMPGTVVKVLARISHHAWREVVRGAFWGS